MRELLERAVPVARFEVEQALGRGRLDTPEGREDALRTVAPVIARLDPGPVQYDLIQLVASRLQISESMTEEALRRAPRTNGAGAAPSRPGAGADERRPPRGHRAQVPLPLPGRQGRRGVARWRRWTSTRSFSIELTRRAAHYLAEHLEHPGQGRCRPTPTSSPATSPSS